ncbi:MAG: ATP-binding protein [Kofleriaceae bacterium]
MAIPREYEGTEVCSAVEPERTSRGAANAYLVCVSGPDLGTTFLIGSGPMVIGRDKSATIRLAETEVSRRHASVEATASGYRLEDLQSSNGTLVNGVRVKRPVPVSVGDRIQIGKTVLVLTQHDELAERVARMQRLEAMGTLAGGIAHDFNNALSVIMLNLELVASELPADSDGARGLEEIRAATTSATALARRLLRLGRPEQLPFAPVDLADLAVRTVAMARKRAAAPIELVVTVPALSALGSYEELHQVLYNLCINAIDAMPKGGRLVVTGRSLVIKAEEALARQLHEAGEYVELTVADTGCGMNEATLARAFEPFFTTKARDQGTGLGLAMIHASIRRHHGAIDVLSAVGAGTTFRVVLPRSGSSR